MKKTPCDKSKVQVVSDQWTVVMNLMNACPRDMVADVDKTC